MDFVLLQNGNTKSLFVPVMNIKRSEFRLRTEINYIFNHLHIQSQNLLFRDDFSFQNLCKAFQNQRERLKVTLVDHHVLRRYAFASLSCF